MQLQSFHEDPAVHHFGPFAVAIATVAGIVGDYKKRQIALEPLRAAIERGQQVDPALIERLMAPEPRDEALNPLYLKVGGIITIAAGGRRRDSEPPRSGGCRSHAVGNPGLIRRGNGSRARARTAQPWAHHSPSTSLRAQQPPE